MVGYPQTSAERKLLPITEGVLDYFPLAVAYVAFVSKVGNDKHNPGEKMHWARGKSDDHPNCIARHLVERGTYDADGLLNDGTLAWRALANLQLTLEDLQKKGHDVWKLFGGQSRSVTAPVTQRHCIEVAHDTGRANPVGNGSGAGCADPAGR